MVKEKVTKLAVKPRILLTGFTPFAGAVLNPSWLAASALDGETIAGHSVISAQLPTAFEASLKELGRLLRLHKPDLVICLGQAGGRGAILLERVALNICDAGIADNAGCQPIDVPVVSNGPVAYFSTLPIKAILQALNDAGIAAEVSQTAGTFVCNHVFYSLMHRLANQSRGCQVRGGFIHIPFVPEQGSPSMSLEQMVRGLRVAISTTLGIKTGIVSSAGRIV